MEINRVYLDTFEESSIRNNVDPSDVITNIDVGYNRGYTIAMKTAISIPDAVFKAAERTAKRLGLSRSELYSTAVRDYIELHQAKNTTKELDKIYGLEDSRLDENLRILQSSSLEREDW